VKEFHLVAGPSGACVRLRSEGKGERAAERSVVMPPAEEGELLNRQLQRAGRDRVFEGALAVIAKM
jgi:glucose-6-phosphate dehydrogenase assembly protein OpcA